MRGISNEAQLLMEDLQLVNKVMGAMRNKLDLCLRRDGAYMEGIGRHQAFKKLASCHFFASNFQYLCNLQKNIPNKWLKTIVLLFLTHAEQKFYNLFLKSYCSGTFVQFHLIILPIMKQRQMLIVLFVKLQYLYQYPRYKTFNLGFVFFFNSLYDETYLYVKVFMINWFLWIFFLT